MASSSREQAGGPRSGAIRIDANPASYGSKGQTWNPAFVEYMVTIASHPTYAGMPDAVKPDGKIQWEAPSNRKSGQYKDTHHKRRDWWRSKAAEIGVSDKVDKWISRTAKLVHPTGEKPCKRCGRVLRIAYVYPGGNLIARAKKLFGRQLVPDPLEEIGLFVQRLVDLRGKEGLLELPAFLETGDIDVPAVGERVSDWLTWLEEAYIPLEPSLLSPGVMSNAPDRFDGFHSFNRCCRGTADTGRQANNMRTYSTDRRVFEYWSEGDWIAADRMMGLIRSQFASHPTADGGAGSPTADHIGPLSLGFTHRPEFRLLSRSANSAKNNRMTLADVEYLRKRENQGESVVSWYARPLWDRLKSRVTSEETALRLSKLLRDNQRNAMGMLSRLLEGGHTTFLASLLELDYANYDVGFEELQVVDHVTEYRRLVRESRVTSYAAEQKARRLRIGFAALRAYGLKTNRHLHTVVDPAIEKSNQRADAILSKVPANLAALNKRITKVLNHAGIGASEGELRVVCTLIPTVDAVPQFADARHVLKQGMEIVGRRFAERWDDERYVRAESLVDD